MTASYDCTSLCKSLKIIKGSLNQRPLFDGCFTRRSPVCPETSAQQAPNPRFPGAITSIKQCGGEILAVRFIDSKRALCDSYRPAEFTDPDH